jgi:hypothetical protein
MRQLASCLDVGMASPEMLADLVVEARSKVAVPHNTTTISTGTVPFAGSPFAPVLETGVRSSVTVPYGTLHPMGAERSDATIPFAGTQTSRQWPPRPTQKSNQHSPTTSQLPDISDDLAKQPHAILIQEGRESPGVEIEIFRLTPQHGSTILTLLDPRGTPVDLQIGSGRRLHVAKEQGFVLVSTNGPTQSYSIPSRGTHEVGVANRATIRTRSFTLIIDAGIPANGAWEFRAGFRVDPGLAHSLFTIALARPKRVILVCGSWSAQSVPPFP